MNAAWKPRVVSRYRLGLVAATCAVALVGIVAGTIAATRDHPTSTDSLTSPGSSAPAEIDTVACADMPHLWSGSGDIAYDPQSRIVQFGWDDGTSARVRDTEPGCASQPGLERELRGNREGALASERASCRELQDLVDAVRAERRSNGQSASGRVPVSDAAQAAAARQSGTPVDLAVAKRRLAGRMLDLDASDKVLEQCPG
jgi:hypothetical protein